MQMTSYTEGIVQGTETSFEMFAKKCIKAFFYNCEIDTQNEELLSETEDDKYYQEVIIESNCKFNILSNDDKGISYFKQYYQAKVKRYSINLKESEIANIRVLKMLEYAKEYKAPSEDYLAFKQFMIDQLSLSLQNDRIEYYKKLLEDSKNKLKDINKLYLELRDEKIKECLETISKSAETLNKLRADRRKNNKWLKVLYKSLKSEYEK